MVRVLGRLVARPRPFRDGAGGHPRDGLYGDYV